MVSELQSRASGDVADSILSGGQHFSQGPGDNFCVSIGIGPEIC